MTDHTIIIVPFLAYAHTIGMRIPHSEFFGVRASMEVNGWRLSFMGIDREDKDKDLLTFVRDTP